MEQENLDLIPIREFCEDVGITVNTLTMYWRPAGQAPELIQRGNRLYLTNAAWDAWFERRERDRKRLRKPHLRAPEATNTHGR